jgi:hypothetical protein
LGTGLSALSAKLKRTSLPADPVTRLIAADRLDTPVPPRWTGRLREDPIRLPSGHRYGNDFEQVEIAGEPVAVSDVRRAHFGCGAYFSSAGCSSRFRYSSIIRRASLAWDSYT